MPDPDFDVAVIGGGHAGLAISYFLKQYGMRQIVLERGRIGESWRSQRWDSFMLNSPNGFNILPGATYRGANPEGFDSAMSFVSNLEGYANRFQLPVQEHTRVISVRRNSSAYHVTASVHGAPERYTSRQVVVASGGMNDLRIPLVAKRISSSIRQLHAGEYRSPSQLPEGGVLVVGSAQSGLQLAEEILQAGRRVYLSTSAVGRVPRRYRGRDIFDWLLRVGFFDVKTEEVTDPRELEMKQPQVSGVGPFGHTLSLQSLARRGAVVIGKIENAGGNEITLQPNAADHIRFSDEVSRRIKGLVDRFIVAHHLNAPRWETDPDDEADTQAACASPIRVLDLGKANITSIIWATGFTADFSYLKDRVISSHGRPMHRNGISNVPGLYFLGLPWLRKRKSGIVNGIVEDAAFIAEQVKLASRVWMRSPV
jgi:putative flavoprotein involved in K+ transport